MGEKLTVLGSGSWGSAEYALHGDRPMRDLSGYLLETPTSKILLECGDGIAKRLLDQRFDITQLDAVCVSHFHSDHFNPVPLVSRMKGMLRERWKTVPKKDIETKVLHMYGPRGIGKAFRQEWGIHNSAKDFTQLLAPHLEVHFHGFENGSQVVLPGGVSMTPYSVIHEGMDAYAMRFSLAEGSLCYTGDMGLQESKVGPELPPAIDGANFLLSEAGLPIGGSNSTNRRKHLTPRQAGEYAKAGRADVLVLTHLPGIDSAEAVTDDARHLFNGHLHVAQDNQVFDLSADQIK